MTKAEFLSQLEKILFGLPQDELEERLSFYAEMIDDQVEEGLTEEEAVAKIGSPDEIAAQIIAETPISSFIKQKVKSNRQINGWVLLLIILASPLLISAAAVVFSLYISLWAVIVSCWSIFVSLAASSLGLLLGGIGFFIGGFTISGLAALAASLVCAGLSIFAFFGCKAATKGTVSLTKTIILTLKKSLSERRKFK